MKDETYNETFAIEDDIEEMVHDNVLSIFNHLAGGRKMLNQQSLEVGGVYERIEIRYTEYEDGYESYFEVEKVGYFKM